MVFLKKYKKLITGLVVLVVFLVTRITNLTILPIFADEAIYIRWSQIIGDDLNHLFIPLTDGKQPLFMWLATPLLKVISDPLFAARIASVLAGLFSVAGVWLATKELFGQKVAFLAIVFYLLTPFVLFYDRLAVPDGLLSAFGIWSLYLSILLVKKLSFKYAVVLGLFLGLSWLTKSPGQFYFFLMPVAALTFNWHQKSIRSKLTKLVILWIMTAGIGFTLYNFLRVSPLFYIIDQRSHDFVFSFREALSHPLDPLMFRPAEIFSWFWNYLTPPILLVGLFGIFVYSFKISRKDMILMAWFLGPLLVESEFAKAFTPRYVIFTIPPFLIILAHFLSEFSEFFKKNKPFLIPYYSLLTILLFPALIFNYYLLTNPQKAAIPDKERTGYLEEWSSGYGIKEIADFVKEKAQQKKVLVGTEGTFGTLPDGLQIYTRGVKNLTVSGMGQMAAIYDVPTSLIQFAKEGGLAYLVVNRQRLLMNIKDPRFVRITEYPKSQGNQPRDYLLLFEVKGQ